MQKVQQPFRQVGICYLRIVATMAVVWLHTCSTLAENPGVFSMTKMQQHFFNAGYFIMRWAVPVFFMITGHLLLNPEKRITFEQCIHKYCMRVVCALFLFGAPFALLKLIMETQSFTLLLMIKAIKCVFNGNSFGHLWYLYALIGVYLLLPLLKIFANNASKTDLVYMLIFLFLFDFIVPFIEKITEIKIAFYIPMQYTIFYVLMGHYLTTHHVVIRNRKAECHIKLISIIIIFMLLIFFEYIDFFSKEWISYDNPLLATLAILIFDLLKDVVKEPSRMQVREWLWKIDRLCFGVYLIHPVFIQFTYRFVKFTPLSTVKAYPLMTIVFWSSFVVCAFMGSWIMSFIKPLKKYVL